MANSTADLYWTKFACRSLPNMGVLTFGATTPVMLSSCRMFSIPAAKMSLEFSGTTEYCNSRAKAPSEMMVACSTGGWTGGASAGLVDGLWLVAAGHRQEQGESRQYKQPAESADHSCSLLSST